MIRRRNAARALAHERHVVAVAAEAADVLSYPNECGALVAECVVGFVAGGAQFARCQQAGGAEAVAGMGVSWMGG